jgi:hypothetical protein
MGKISGCRDEMRGSFAPLRMTASKEMARMTTSKGRVRMMALKEIAGITTSKKIARRHV